VSERFNARCAGSVTGRELRPAIAADAALPGGDWGDLTAEDKRLNDEAIKHGGRILSAYILPDGVKIWVITEAQSVDDDPRSRMSTCLLLPDEY
jgi:hypothetical protein